jgi:hypothetical protein
MLWNLREVPDYKRGDHYGSAPENSPATSKDRENLTVQRMRGVRLGGKRTSSVTPGRWVRPARAGGRALESALCLPVDYHLRGYEGLLFSLSSPRPFLLSFCIMVSR